MCVFDMLPATKKEKADDTQEEEAEEGGEIESPEGEDDKDDSADGKGRYPDGGEGEDGGAENSPA